jgi:UDP-N-acetylglucosamine 2-epimerase (non-hydrolysing)
VQGDTNSVLAGGITTSKMDITLGHVEAGLRSHDRSMPEETNRVVTDHVSDLLFTPTADGATLLKNEGISDNRIHVTGNTIVDAVEQNKELAAEQSSILSELALENDEYAVMTAHRAENVDYEDHFSAILEGAKRVAERRGLRIIYPIHPRAEERLAEFNLTVPSVVELIDPLDYLDFLQLQQNATLILTDSGGVQEEACILGVPCVTMRRNTERPETISVGTNVLAGYKPDEILNQSLEMLEMSGDWDNPFGDGTASEQILDIVTN